MDSVTHDFQESSSQTLTALLSHIGRVIRGNVNGRYWVTAELINLKRHGSGHIYLQLSDTNEGGQQAQARAVIWSSRVGIVSVFERETKIRFAPNIRVMLLVEVQFSPQYGLSLNVVDINANYTVGAFELKLQRIRKHLKDLDESDLNRSLSTPLDFSRVAVIAPNTASGLKDFRSKADILSKFGLCHFDYFNASFQGPQRFESIVSAFQTLIENEHDYDAVCFIRGGGDKAGLNELSESKFARAVCRCIYPVFTGVGHDDDQTLLDEYSNMAFGTPSMVINHIEQAIIGNALAAREAYVRLKAQAAGLCDKQRQINQHNKERIELAQVSVIHTWKYEVKQLGKSLFSQSKEKISDGKFRVVNELNSLLKNAKNQINQDALEIQRYQQKVVSSAKGEVQSNKSMVVRNHERLLSSSRDGISKSKQNTRATLNMLQMTSLRHIAEQKLILKRDVFELNHIARANLKDSANNVRDMIRGLAVNGDQCIRHQKQELYQANEGVMMSAGRVVFQHKKDIEGWNQLINAYNPERVLERGYALVFDNESNVIMSSTQLNTGQNYQVKFKDGIASLKNELKEDEDNESRN